MVSLELNILNTASLFYARHTNEMEIRYDNVTHFNDEIRKWKPPFSAQIENAPFQPRFL